MRLSRIKKKSEDEYALELAKRSRQVYRQPEPIEEVFDLPPPTSESSINYLNTAVIFICPTCKTSSNAKFCGNDGSRLELSCSNCHTPVKGAKFCGSCGSKLV